MATTKKRINISLAPETEKALAQLAKRDRVPTAAKAVALLESALEIEEDIVLGRLADERLKSAKKWLTHEEVWEK